MIKAKNVRLKHHLVVGGGSEGSCKIRISEYDLQMHNCDVVCRRILGKENPDDNAPASDGSSGTFSIDDSSHNENKTGGPDTSLGDHHLISLTIHYHFFK